MTDPTNSGWSAPFSDWVVEGWREYSEQIGGPEIAAKLREGLSDPQAARARAINLEKQKQAALAKLTPAERELLGI